MVYFRRIIIQDHWHNAQRRRTCESHRASTRALVLITFSPDAVDDVATCDQHNERVDASVRLVSTTNPQQIEVMEFALNIVAEIGDSRRKR